MGSSLAQVIWYKRSSACRWSGGFSRGSPLFAPPSDWLLKMSEIILMSRKTQIKKMHVTWSCLGFQMVEPYHEIMVLFILQTSMCSHPVGLDVWFLVGPFVYFRYFMCVNSEGSGQMRMLAWAFAGHLCDKYHHQCTARPAHSYGFQTLQCVKAAFSSVANYMIATFSGLFGKVLVKIMIP